MTKKTKRPIASAQLAAETGRAVQDAAVRAGGVARRLLRRTRLLTNQAAPRLPAPAASILDQAAPPAGHVTPALPDVPLHEKTSQEAASREAALEEQLAELRLRAERAEYAAAWLRARLRAERGRAQAPPPDMSALAGDLTRELARLYAAHPDVVRRIVQRVFAAHGLPIAPSDGERDAGLASQRQAGPRSTRRRTWPARDVVEIDGSAWPREQQEALAAQALARTPEIADPAYIYRVVALLAQRGRLNVAGLTQAAGLGSAMARRRLRLAVETLAELGALDARNGAYTINTSYRPAAPAAATPAAPTGRRGERGMHAPRSRDRRGRPRQPGQLG